MKSYLHTVQPRSGEHSQSQQYRSSDPSPPSCPASHLQKARATNWDLGFSLQTPTPRIFLLVRTGLALKQQVQSSSLPSLRREPRSKSSLLGNLKMPFGANRLQSVKLLRSRSMRLQRRGTVRLESGCSFRRQNMWTTCGRRWL
jgi:hypothetical protein